MKVLILGSKEYPFGVSDDKLPSGGMEAYTQELVAHLVKLGITPVIVTRKLKKLPSFEIKKGVEIHRVGWMNGFWLRGPSFNFFSFLKGLKLDFDIILVNAIQASFFGHVLSRLKNKPLIIIPHGMLHTQSKYGKVITKIAFLLEKFLYARNNLVLLSKEEAEKFRKAFGVKKYTIIPTPVDTDRFGVKGQKPKDLTIAFVGRLAEVKGVKYLLKAIPLLKGKFKIKIVGSGPEEDELKSLAESLHLASKVEFTGMRLDVDKILKSANIFVLPSLSEGLPISLLEAMASSCACVVTDIGLPVKNKENALVVPPANPRKLANAINLLISNEKLREKLGLNARKYVEKFSWTNAANQFKEIFDNSVRKSSS